MNQKLFLFDFDGTLVTEDILDVLCEFVNKKEESENLKNSVLQGNADKLMPLCERINFLKGISYTQIEEKLNQENYLQKGAIELFQELKKLGFIIVLSSGNILPVLEYYQKLLGIDYIFGTSPKINNNVIEGIELSDFKGHNFKYDNCLNLINKLQIPKENIYAIGDSAVDIDMLTLARHKFAINPKGGIEKFADIVIKDDLTELIKYL